MAGSGVSGGDGPTNVVQVNFQSPGHPNRGRTNSATASSTKTLRTEAEELSKRNDPFQKLTTRLTYFFSKPESQNDKAQEIKNACWDDLTDDKRPVFEPNFGNLTNATFSKSPKGLTITLSQDHVDQGYLQVLSDLTLVAEVIKRSINQNSENAIVGFTSDPIEKIKIISHPKRNTEITVQEMRKNNPYEIGPEFKFVNSIKNGIIPVANGMFNLDDVLAGKHRTSGENNHQLEVLAFNRSENTLNNPLLHMFEIHKPILTAQNKIYLTTDANPDSYENEAIMQAFKYHDPQNKLLELLGDHNNGKVFHKTTHKPPQRYSPDTDHLDPIYTASIRNMSDYTPDDKNSEYYHHGTGEMLRHPDLGALARIDSLKLLTQGAYTKDYEGMLTTQYTKNNVNRQLLRDIHTKHQAAATKGN